MRENDILKEQIKNLYNEKEKVGFFNFQGIFWSNNFQLISEMTHQIREVTNQADYYRSEVRELNDVINDLERSGKNIEHRRHGYDCLVFLKKVTTLKFLSNSIVFSLKILWRWQIFSFSKMSTISC